MIKFRRAILDDLPEIIEMLANDDLGKLREHFISPLPDSYYDAFNNIDNDESQELIVVESDGKEIIGTMQLTFIQYLTYKGGIRAQIESVRIKENKRGIGIGRSMIEWAIEKAKERGAHLLQLTTDKKRPEAIKFYQNLGFRSTHEGMKLML